MTSNSGAPISPPPATSWVSDHYIYDRYLSTVVQAAHRALLRMTTHIAVIFGAGPGLAASVARALAPTHSLMLLSRSLPGSLPKLDLGDIPDDKLLAVSSDGSQQTLKEAFDKMEKKWPGGIVDFGIFNSGGGFNPGKFLERTEQEFRDNLESFA